MTEMQKLAWAQALRTGAKGLAGIGGGLGLAGLENKYIGHMLPEELKNINLGIGATTGLMAANPATRWKAVSSLPFKQLGLLGTGVGHEYVSSQKELADTNLDAARHSEEAAQNQEAAAKMLSYGLPVTAAGLLLWKAMGNGGDSKREKQPAVDGLEATRSVGRSRRYLSDGESVGASSPFKLDPSDKIRIDVPPGALPSSFYEGLSLGVGSDESDVQTEEHLNEKQEARRLLFPGTYEDVSREEQKDVPWWKRAAVSTKPEVAGQFTNLRPTEGQATAGNYKKGKCRLHGMIVSIENPRGSIRSGKDKTGKQWSTRMAHHYGYVLRSSGADGDHVDCFIGPTPESEMVYVIDQSDGKGGFDEHKAMLGFVTQEEAKRGYLSNYEKGWNRIKSITPMTVHQFKRWLKHGSTKMPIQGQSIKLARTDGDSEGLWDTTRSGANWLGNALWEMTGGPEISRGVRRTNQSIGNLLNGKGDFGNAATGLGSVTTGLALARLGLPVFRMAPGVASTLGAGSRMSGPIGSILSGANRMSQSSGLVPSLGLFGAGAGLKGTGKSLSQSKPEAPEGTFSDWSPDERLRRSTTPVPRDTRFGSGYVDHFNAAMNAPKAKGPPRPTTGYVNDIAQTLYGLTGAPILGAMDNYRISPNQLRGAFNQ